MILHFRVKSVAAWMNYRQRKKKKSVLNQCWSAAPSLHSSQHPSLLHGADEGRWAPPTDRTCPGQSSPAAVAPPPDRPRQGVELQENISLKPLKWWNVDLCGTMKLIQHQQTHLFVFQWKIGGIYDQFRSIMLMRGFQYLHRIQWILFCLKLWFISQDLAATCIFSPVVWKY